MDGAELSLAGKRVRFWGFIGGSIGGKAVSADGAVREGRKELDLWANRIADLGFNLYRTWESGEVMATQHDYQPGDGSRADQSAYFYNKLAERGVRLWMSSAHSLGTFGRRMSMRSPILPRRTSGRPRCAS